MAPESGGRSGNKPMGKQKRGEQSDIFKLIQVTQRSVPARSRASMDRSKSARHGQMIVARNYDPVIIFAFSKKECEALALNLSKLDFNTDEERAVPRSAVLGCASCSCVRACVRGRVFRLPRGVLPLRHVSCRRPLDVARAKRWSSQSFSTRWRRCRRTTRKYRRYAPCRLVLARTVAVRHSIATGKPLWSCRRQLSTRRSRPSHKPTPRQQRAV